MRTIVRSSVLAILCLWLMVAFAGAEEYNTFIDYEGFGVEHDYENEGFDFSHPGDEINLIARVTNVDSDIPGAPWYYEDNEYTLVVTGLISNGEMVEGDMSTIIYNWGNLQIYEDSSFNSDWDEIPVIGSPPPTFADGNLWLTGDFIDFTLLVWRDMGMGMFEGHIDITGGSAYDFFQSEQDAYTFAGLLVPPHNPGIPDHYHLSFDGELWVRASTAVGNQSWSALKALF